MQLGLTSNKIVRLIINTYKASSRLGSGSLYIMCNTNIRKAIPREIVFGKDWEILAKYLPNVHTLTLFTGGMPTYCVTVALSKTLFETAQSRAHHSGRIARWTPGSATSYKYIHNTIGNSYYVIKGRRLNSITSPSSWNFTPDTSNFHPLHIFQSQNITVLTLHTWLLTTAQKCTFGLQLRLLFPLQITLH
jgi:hypothetical protein